MIKFIEVLSKLLAAFVLMLAPIHPVLITIFVLTFSDFTLGIVAARKRGEPITSKRGGDSVVKLFIYTSVIVNGYLIETFMLGGRFPIVAPCAGIIALVQFKSYLENASTILGRDLFKEVIDRLGSKSDKNAPKE